jgi:hypothetical protein
MNNVERTFINNLIGEYEEKMNIVDTVSERFELWQKIKCLQLQLDKMADQTPAFYVFR